MFRLTCKNELASCQHLREAVDAFQNDAWQGRLPSGPELAAASSRFLYVALLCEASSFSLEAEEAPTSWPPGQGIMAWAILAGQK